MKHPNEKTFVDVDGSDKWNIWTLGIITVFIVFVFAMLVMTCHAKMSYDGLGEIEKASNLSIEGGYLVYYVPEKHTIKIWQLEEELIQAQIDSAEICNRLKALRELYSRCEELIESK